MSKVVFITGGAYGLGEELVKYFLEKKDKVFFTYRNSEENAKRIIEKYKDNVKAYKADASDFVQAQLAVDECISNYGKVDVLINNAASANDGTIMQLSEAGFNYTIKNVLYPVFNYTKAVSKYMVERKKGKIINIGSINGARGREGSLAYSSAKAGVVGFSKTIAKELGEYNICCNVVEPGYISTESQETTSELIKRLVLDECVIRRLTKPGDVANLVGFLSSDLADNITGQVYRIDCGQYI